VFPERRGSRLIDSNARDRPLFRRPSKR